VNTPIRKDKKMIDGAAMKAIACAAIFMAFSPHAFGKQGMELEVRGSEIVYRGDIGSDAVDRIGALLVAHPEVTRLSIGSGGGDVEAGMKLGDLVLERGLDVRVLAPLCASSCANYVFVSGKNKIIDEGAVVLWHGSPLLPEAVAITETRVDAEGNSTEVTYEGEALAEYNRRPDIAASNERIRLEQVAFFERRGVDGRVTIFGQQVGCDCNWTFSVEDMVRFGIGSVHADGGYPTAMEWWADLDLKQLAVADHLQQFNAGKE